MGYRSQVGIAVISQEKITFEQVKQAFRQSQFYKMNTGIADELLSLFQERQKGADHLIIIYEVYIKWYEDIDQAWKTFSEICNRFNLRWCFIRIGEEYHDVEEENNYYQFNDHDNCLWPYDIFGFFRDIHCFV